MSENVSWLVTCPCGDGNFKERLKSATAKEIEQALAELDEKYTQDQQKAKRTALRAQSKRIMS